MEVKDLILIIIALFGWIWGITQFFLKRKIQKKDKIVDRRFETYSAYLKKSDELMQNLRTDPNSIFSIFPEFINSFLSNDKNISNNALTNFNTKLFELVKKSSEPLMILNQELSSLSLIASNELVPKIEELKLLANDFNNETKNILNVISSNQNEGEKAKQYNAFSYNERWKRFESLNNEILKLMRKEIGVK